MRESGRVGAAISHNDLLSPKGGGLGTERSHQGPGQQLKGRSPSPRRGLDVVYAAIGSALADPFWRRWSCPGFVDTLPFVGIGVRDAEDTPPIFL
jgi:hypothetical protein